MELDIFQKRFEIITGFWTISFLILSLCNGIRQDTEQKKEKMYWLHDE